MNFISIFCKINMRIFIMAKFDPAVTFSNNFMRLPLESPAGEANNHYPGKYQRCEHNKTISLYHPDSRQKHSRLFLLPPSNVLICMTEPI